MVWNGYVDGLRIKVARRNLSLGMENAVVACVGVFSVIYKGEI